MVSWAGVLNSGRRGEFLLSGWPDDSARFLSPVQAGLLVFFHLEAIMQSSEQVGLLPTQKLWLVQNIDPHLTYSAKNIETQ